MGDGKFANENLRKVWEALGRIPEPLYLLVGDRSEAQAHLLGSFAVERVDAEDVIVLQNTRTHVHVQWSAITGIERAEQDGYDCLRFIDGQRPILQLLAGDTSYRFQAEVLTAIERSNQLKVIAAALSPSECPDS